MAVPFCILILFFYVVLGKGNIVDDIQAMYLQQGIPFRENIFLGNLPILPEYDFIIVGSGPAGSAIANRLSEEPQWNILLLEAGLEGNIYNDIPFINELTVLGNFSVNYEMEKQENVCSGLVGGKCYWSSGNGLGGATLINAMIYARGRPSDYNRWALEGSLGWSYDEVLPYFLKIENMSIPALAESEYHSKDGPVHIQFPFQTEIGKRFLEAGQELGYNLIDYNNPNTMIGFSRTQTTIRGVKRESAASAYLLPVKSRPNLHIVKNALVTELLTNLDTKEVRGVKFLKNDNERIVRAKKEVILSAGAFGSPKILMLSGIGPANHLKEMGIPLIADLPVGYNLQEHLGLPVAFLINSTDSITLPKLFKSFLGDFRQWLRGEEGLFSSNLAESMGFVQTKYATDDEPDIDLIAFPNTLGGYGGILWAKTRNISKELYDKTWEDIFYKEGFSIVAMLMYPRSRGQVRLRSRNPRVPIVINGNLLSHPEDINILREGLRIAIRFAKTKTFEKIGAGVHINPIYGCEKSEFDSDEYWECAMRTVTGQFHHQCGTCRMGADPLWSVVDPRLRVHGLTGLRVADASIIPIIPGSHPMAPCYMIGEKAADMIKEDWEDLQIDPRIGRATMIDDVEQTT